MNRVCGSDFSSHLRGTKLCVSFISIRSKVRRIAICIRSVYRRTDTLILESGARIEENERKRIRYENEALERLEGGQRTKVERIAIRILFYRGHRTIRNEIVITQIGE